MAATGTEVVTDELVDLIATCLANHWKKGQVKRLIYEVAGRRVARGTVEKLLSRARALLMQEANIDASEERAKAIAFWKGIVADEDSTPEQKMKAQESLENMIKLRHSGGKTPIEQARAMRDAGLAMDKSTDGDAD